MHEAQAPMERDFQVFEQHRKEWAEKHRDEYVVIHAGILAGFHRDYESALRAALQAFGVESQFLVKQVSSEEPVFVIY